jgi:hypothetical protein
MRLKSQKEPKEKWENTECILGSERTAAAPNTAGDVGAERESESESEGSTSSSSSAIIIKYMKIS